jgi:hypothetical protein
MAGISTANSKTSLALIAFALFYKETDFSHTVFVLQLVMACFFVARAMIFCVYS